MSKVVCRRTAAILIAVVDPDLGHRDLGLFVSIRIDNAVIRVRLIDCTGCNILLYSGRSGGSACFIVSRGKSFNKYKTIRHFIVEKFCNCICCTLCHVGNAEPLICLQINCCGATVIEPVETGISIFRRCVFYPYTFLNNSITVIRIRLYSKPDGVIPFIIPFLAAVRIIRVVNRDLDCKDSIFRNILNSHDLLDRQIASTVIIGLKYTLLCIRDLISVALNSEIIHAICTCRAIRLNQNLLIAIYDHRAVYIRCQIPTIAEADRFNNRVFMAGLDDIVTIVCQFDLTERNIDILIRSLYPLVLTVWLRITHFNIKVCLITFHYRQGDILCFSGVDLVIPVLNNVDRRRRQLHLILRQHGRCIRIALIIELVGCIQVRVSQQVINTGRILVDSYRQKFFIGRHGVDQAVVQVSNIVIRFLAGPYIEFDRV